MLWFGRPFHFYFDLNFILFRLIKMGTPEVGSALVFRGIFFNGRSNPAAQHDSLEIAKYNTL